MLEGIWREEDILAVNRPAQQKDIQSKWGYIQFMYVHMACGKIRILNFIQKKKINVLDCYYLGEV